MATAMRGKILLLVVGILIGLAAAVLVPRFRELLTPSALKKAPTEGTVEDKRSDEDRLLLTLVTAEGAVLATFTRQVAEIDLLVARGDTVSLALDGYRPFVEDPEIERVVKGPPAGDVPPLEGSASPAVGPGGEPPEQEEPPSSEEPAAGDEPATQVQPTDQDAPEQPSG